MIYRVSVLQAGKRLNLRLEAEDPEQAAALARGDGHAVLRVQPAGGRWRGAARFPLLLFTRELLALLDSGLTLVEALQTLHERETAETPRQVLAGVLARLRQGESFSAALGRFPEAFPALYAASVRAAESTGDLVPALGRYAAWRERSEAARAKVVTAALYPLLLLGLGGLVTLFLIGFVTPRFAAIYADNPASLPWASQVLMALGSWLDAHGAALAPVLLAALGGAVWGVRRPAARAVLARLMWRLPGVGERLRVFHLARFYRTVGMLLSGGVPILTALDMAAGLLSEGLRRRLTEASGHIRAGLALSQAMERAGLTTPVAARLLRVGERGGRMGEMMERIAVFHDDESHRFIDRASRLFEPLLMAFIGVMVGIIVVLLYLPIFELAGSIE